MIVLRVVQSNCGGDPFYSEPESHPHPKRAWYSSNVSRSSDPKKHGISIPVPTPSGDPLDVIKLICNLKSYGCPGHGASRPMRKKTVSSCTASFLPTGMVADDGSKVIQAMNRCCRSLERLLASHSTAVRSQDHNQRSLVKLGVTSILAFKKVAAVLLRVWPPITVPSLLSGVERSIHEAIVVGALSAFGQYVLESNVVATLRELEVLFKLNRGLSSNPVLPRQSGHDY